MSENTQPESSRSRSRGRRDNTHQRPLPPIQEGRYLQNPDQGSQEAPGISAHTRRDQISTWLAPEMRAWYYRPYYSKRIPGTGNWLLRSPEYQKWVNGSKEVLLCVGCRGVGKTALASMVIEDLHGRCSGMEDVRVAYAFNHSIMAGAGGALKELLLQLVGDDCAGIDWLGDLYDGREGDKITVEEVCKGLQRAVAMYSRVYVVVDAIELFFLPEFKEDEIREVLSLLSYGEVSVLATSQPILGVTEAFAEYPRLDIRAPDSNIAVYVDSRLSVADSMDLDLKQRAKTEIIQAADGIFFLAEYFCDILEMTEPSELDHTIEHLRHNAMAYDQLYRPCMWVVVRQKPLCRILAAQALTWVAYAKRPLTIQELTAALVYSNLNTDPKDQQTLPPNEILSVCIGLVSVDPITQIINYTHQTIGEYIRSAKEAESGPLRTLYEGIDPWLTDPQCKMANICASYLTCDAFATGPCPTDESFTLRLSDYRFYNYAAEHWGHHAKAAVKPATKVMDFLNSPGHVGALAQVSMMSDRGLRHPGFSQEYPRNVTALHLAAYFGLAGPVVGLISGGAAIAARDSRGFSPMDYAIGNGHAAVAVLLRDVSGGWAGRWV
ncbi:hypothetical protein BDV25DRAFT_137326 [Aspergillus avenaceus]|uniref:AAA+ ATPase domain-containing protein n=1 Tax=Aspergillus avenaceus TaxID=36643 RepID=A0A5N6U4B5_ASPAV|nr:hypothetical protein BDV25DRAFT_137326 [Aspergillus avenaceus]